MRLFVLGLIAVALPACSATGGMFGGGVSEIISTPPGATASIDGFGECETPCTVRVDQARYVTIAKAGYTPQTIRLEPGGKTISVELELAAPTGEVDTQTLPDLD